MSLLENFFAYCDEHEDATSNLSIETVMTMFCRNEGVLVEDAVEFGIDLIGLLAAGFSAFVEANEDISIADLFDAFTDNYCLSPQMAEQLARTLGEAAEEDDDEEDEPDDGEGVVAYEDDPNDGEGGAELRMRRFLTKLLTNVPSSFAPYFGALKRFGKLDYLGNDWGGSTPDGRYDPRNRRMGHLPAEAERTKGFPSVYDSDAVTAALSEEELDEHWFHSHDVGDYSIHQGAGVHGGMWAAREKGKGAHRDLHTFSGKHARKAAEEHAELSTHAKHNGLTEDVDMLLSPTEGGDLSHYLDRSLQQHGKYGAGVKDTAHATNRASLETKHWKEGVAVPHSAVAEAQAHASLNGWGVRVQKVHHHHTHLLFPHAEAADSVAEHVGELYGRLVTNRFTLSEPEPEPNQYRKTELAQGLKKKVSVKEQRKMAAACVLMEKANRPNTWNPTQQNLQDQVEADKNKYVHPDGDGLPEPELR